MDVLYKRLIDQGVEETEAMLKATVFFVEATDAEKYLLWVENKYVTEDKYKVTWEQHKGFMQTVGYLNIDGEDKPVNVSCMFDIIDDYRVCFYHSCSRYVDHTMIDEWIQKYAPKYDNNTRLCMSDAHNFAHATMYIRKLNGV